MAEFKVGDKVKYVGRSHPECRGKVFTVEETRSLFFKGAPKIKEMPGEGFWRPDVWELCSPRSFTNK